MSIRGGRCRSRDIRESRRDGGWNGAEEPVVDISYSLSAMQYQYGT